MPARTRAPVRSPVPRSPLTRRASWPSTPAMPREFIATDETPGGARRRGEAADGGAAHPTTKAARAEAAALIDRELDAALIWSGIGARADDRRDAPPTRPLPAGDPTASLDDGMDSTPGVMRSPAHSRATTPPRSLSGRAAGH